MIPQSGRKVKRNINFSEFEIKFYERIVKYLLDISNLSLRKTQVLRNDTVFFDGFYKTILSKIAYNTAHFQFFYDFLQNLP